MVNFFINLLSTEMLFDGKAVHLNKGDSFTFYENEPSIQGPGNYVNKGDTGGLLLKLFCRSKLKGFVEMSWLGIKFTLTMDFWLLQ